jgi:protein TonB
MATYDYPGELVRGIEYPCPERPSLRIDRRRAASPAEREKPVLVDSASQGKEVGDIFYFIEPRPRNSWATIGSFSLLSILIVALIVVPLFHTDPLPKRETLTTLYLQPPAAAGSSGVKLRVPTSKPTYVPSTNAISAPTPPTQKEESVPDDASGGAVGGVPGGVIGGVAGGTLSGVLGTTSSVPVLAKAPEPTLAKRVRIPTRVAEANLIHDVPPQYPPEAGRSRVEGIVVLMAVIGKDGTVKDVRVESGLPLLAQAAIDAVKQWRYKPYLIDGEPVEVDSRITINFTLTAS